MIEFQSSPDLMAGLTLGRGSGVSATTEDICYQVTGDMKF